MTEGARGGVAIARVEVTRQERDMILEHNGARPTIHPDAYIAPTAVLVGDVRVSAGARILHGAVLTAEDGSITVGPDSVVMENALVKGRAHHPVTIGRSVLVGPHAHVNGAVVGDEVFIATGASVFPGAHLGAGSEVRINAVVQVNTRVEAGGMVPIGWVAVGDPAHILPPDRHEEIWAVQRELDFPGTVYGMPRGTSMRDLMRAQSEFYGSHRDDRVVE
jgi:carbonic anhydrase/acetyltransferase-like protein (isoleucine patch superfamily)